MKILDKMNEEFRIFNLSDNEELDLDDLGSDENYTDGDDGLDDFFSQNDDLQFGSDDETYNLDDMEASSEEDGLGDFFSQGGEESKSELALDDENYNLGDESDDVPGLDDGEMNNSVDMNNMDDMGLSDDEGMDMGSETEEEPETDPDFQGTIRTVKGANLVYKRQNPEGSYDELWIYNVGKDINKEAQIRRAILADTDIDPNNEQSEDGTQSTDSYSVGNVNYIHITGLPS